MAVQEFRATGRELRGRNVGSGLIRVGTLDAVVVHSGDDVVVDVAVADRGVVEGKGIEGRGEQRAVEVARGGAAVDAIASDSTGTGVPCEMNCVLGGGRRRRRCGTDPITGEGDRFG